MIRCLFLFSQVGNERGDQRVTDFRTSDSVIERCNNKGCTWQQTSESPQP